MRKSSATTVTPGSAGPANPTGRLSRRGRNLLLIVHIVVAVGALGTDLVLFSLGGTALANDDPELIRAAYLAMDVVASTVLAPLAVAAVGTGVLLALASPWGLVRYYWVLVKFVITLIAATAAVFALRPTLGEAAATARALSPDELSATGIGEMATQVAVAPLIGVLLLTIAVVLAVGKPWGRIRSRRAADG